MSTLSIIALAGAFLIPIAAVVLLRYLRTRMTVIPFYSLGGLLFILAAAAVIWLVRSRVETVTFGGLTLIQPQGAVVALPPRDPLADDPGAALEPTPAEAVPTAPLSTVSIPTPTIAPRATPTGAPTPSRTPLAPTPSRTPLAPTATPEPPTATPEPPTAEPAPETRTYTVQPGDTLRSIAADFGVSVQSIIDANDLTAAEADSLQPGDTLIIP